MYKFDAKVINVRLYVKIKKIEENVNFSKPHYKF